MKQHLLQYDIDILRWVQAGKIDGLDAFFYWLSYTTTHVAIVIIVSVAILFFKKRGFLAARQFISFNVLFFSSLFTSTLLKYTILRARPFVSFPDILHLYDTTTSSFPSGHTITAFALAFGFVFLKVRPVYLVLTFLWAALVAYSRLALGSHYPSDILASFLIVCCYAAIVKRKASANTIKNAEKKQTL